MNVEHKRDLASLSLVSLYEISKILSSSTNLAAALRAVLNLMSSYLQMRRGVVAIVDEAGTLEIVASCPGRAIGESGSADLPEEVARRILAGQMPFVTENVAEHPLLVEYLGTSGAVDGERVSLIGVPIKTFGRPFGVLAVARVWTDANEVSFGDDIRLLTMVANLIAQTVRLHQRVSERTAVAARPVSPTVPLRPLVRKSLKTIGDGSVIGLSKAMQEVYAQIHLVAPTRSTVILRGESGTGKELLARAVHMLSPRKDKPFIKVNCAALPDTLLESELFGHEKGAFTGAIADRKGRFELADGGTLFLDEIGDVSPPFQAKLLRVLQEREFERLGGTRTLKVDVRFVFATNRNLEEAVAKGDFRADLYYRINVVPVFVPALRERREDIPALAEHFLKLFNQENNRSMRFADTALSVLASCRFPGNVRELENCVQRVATMTVGELIEDLSMPCQTSQCHCQVLASRIALPPSSPLPSRAAMEGDRTNGTASDGRGNLDGGEQARDPDRDPGADSGLADIEPHADWSEIDDLSDLNAIPQRDRLIRVMEKAGWVQAKAARILGLTPRQVGYALRKHNIPIKRL
ncbi:MAG: nif-specific transcriptional activator NifA [Rhodospirillales bacterium]